MGDVNYLLISDMHRMENYDWDLMKKGLRNLLKNIKINFVIMLGDFHNYNEKDYHKAEEFIRRLAKECKLSLSKDIFFVPGNHDAEELNELKEYREKLESNKYSNCEDIFDKLDSRFDKYNDFISRLLNKQDLKSPASVHLRKWNNINIVHLNTALISDGTREHKEIIDIEKLASIEIDNNPTIMIGHHTLNDINNELFHRIIDFARENNVSVYYHGDTHKVGQEIHTLNGKPTCECILPEFGVYKADADSTDAFSDFGIIIGTIKNGSYITHLGYQWCPGTGFNLDSRVHSERIEIKSMPHENIDSSNKNNGSYKQFMLVATILVLISYGMISVISNLSEINISNSNDERDNSIEVYSDYPDAYSEDDEEKRSGESNASIESIADDFSEEDVVKSDDEELITYHWDEQARLIDLNDYTDLTPEALIAKADSNFLGIIMNKSVNVDLEQEMSSDYANFVKAANDIYDKVDDNSEYIEICEDILDAVEYRDNAKNQYRQASNEQIEGNYYSRCAIDAKNNGYTDEEFRFYQKAIEYYIDAYSVALARGNERTSALEYMATCYHRIGDMKNLDAKIRIEAYLCSICIWNEYLGKTDEKKLITDLSVGRTYFSLCQLSDNMDTKYSYFYLAKDSFEECLNNGQCGPKTTPDVLSELRHLCQYCYDNIDENAYEDGCTKNDVIKWRNDYSKRLERYE